MSTKAMKQALEATEVLKSLFRQAEARHAGLFPSPNVVCQITVEDLRKGLYAADTLRTAIEQAEKQEPVATVVGKFLDRKDTLRTCIDPELPLGTKFYTTPPAAPDLLETLKRIVDEPNNTMSDGKALKEIIRIARLAITKATGEKT